MIFRGCAIMISLGRERVEIKNTSYFYKFYIQMSTCLAIRNAINIC